MAVEIPVLVDIMGGIDKAVKDVPKAMEKIRGAVSKDQIDLFPHIEKSLENLAFAKERVQELNAALKGMLSGSEKNFFAFDPKGLEQITRALLEAQAGLNRMPNIQPHVEALTRADFELLRMREHYKALEESSRRLSDSINGYRERLSDLSKQWNQLTVSQKYDASGKMTAEARQLYEQFRKESIELQKQGQTLDQLFQKEQRRVEKHKQVLDSRKREEAILNATTKTLSVLHAKEQVLSDRLSKATIGSNKYKQLQKDLADLRIEIQKAEGNLGGMNTALNRQSVVLRNLTSIGSMYFSLFGALRFVKQIRDVTGELEYQRIALGHLIQDEEYGAVLFERIKEAAVESPFRIKELVTYTKQLAAYKIAQEDLFDTTKRLADVSAGLGVDMNRLILAYGQVRAASVLRGQELRQFTEAGIPLVDLLADKFEELNGRAVSTADVFKLISQRAVPFSMIADIFEDLTEKGGMFYKMQEEQANTLKGRWEKLKDAYDIALQSIGETKTFEVYNNIILNSLTVLSKNITLVPKLLEGLTVAWASYTVAVKLSNASTRQAISTEIALAASRKADAANIGKLTVAVLGETRARELLTRAYAKQAVATNALSRTFWKLTAAMLSNPISAIIAGVAALTTFFLAFRKRVDETAQSIRDYSEAMNALTQADRQYKQTEKLIDKYEELAKKTERTNEENAKLADIMDTLALKFPGVRKLIEDENRSLEDNVDLLRSKNEEQKKDAIKNAQQQKTIQEGVLKTLQKQREERVADYEAAYDEVKRYEALQNLHKDDASYQNSVERAYENASMKADKLSAEIDEYDSKILTVTKHIEALDKYLNPQEAKSNWEEWQNQLEKMSTYKLSLGEAQIFTPDDIGALNGVYDLYKKLKKIWQESKTEVEGLYDAYQNAVDAAAKTKLFTEYQDALAKFNKSDEIRQFYGWDFTTKRSGSGYRTDPWITQMQDRMKFMQDFKKGYDDLRKYLGSNDALAKEAEIMKGRGLSLGLDSSQQDRAASDLSKWYEDMISAVSERMRAKGARGDTVTDLLGIDTTKKSKGLQELQRLLQSLWDAKTDFDTSEKKKELENALKKLSDEIKRSETARDFYKNILDLTGDEQLAATMSLEVYGQTGDQLKEQIAKQLSDSFVIDPDLVPSDRSMDAITADISKAIASGNYGELEKFLEYVVEQNRNAASEIIQNWQKTSADRMQTWVKELQRTKEYADRRVDIERVTAERIREIQESTLPESDKASLIARYTEKQTRDIAKLQYETFKDSEMYINLFDNLDNASRRSLENMRDKLTEMRDSLKELDPTQLKDIQSRINEVDKQLARRNPFKAIADALKEYRDLREKSSRRGADEDLISASAEEAKQEERLAAAIRRAKEAQDQYNAAVKAHGADSEEANRAKNLRDMANQQLKAEKKRTKESKKSADDAQVLVHAFQKVSDQIDAAAEGLKVWQERINQITDGVSKLMHAFSSDEDAEFFDEIAGSFNEILSGGIAAGQGLAKVLAGDMTGIIPLAKGVVDMVAGVGNISNAARVRKANKEIERQQKIIDDLEYSYGRLSDTISETFGADYIYNFNEMISQQEAKIVALQAQLAAEQSKGRKKSKEAIEDYMRSIREAEDELADFKDSASEYWAGSTLTSAAQDFANAWYEAYREYGNTLDAMKERMNDMVQNLIVKSAMAGVVEAVFKPWFDKLNEATARGTLTDDVVSLVNELDAVVLDANNGLSVVANKFRSLGYELRGSATSFTGISRDIASASEESINGLAAGINTQNFYISHVPTISENVAAILALMSGGATMIPNETPENGGLSYTDQMLSYASYIPQMSTDMYAVRSLLEKVIKPSGNAYYVSVR